MAFIEAQQVRFSYDAESVDAREVLHGVDLSIEEGEFVALLGHNGCGKSTMAKLFNGMLVPTAGKVLVGGIDTSVEETPAGRPPPGGLGAPKPRQPACGRRGGGGRGLWSGELGRSPRGDTPPGGGRPQGCGHVRVPGARPPQALRRAEAAGGHCGHHRHGDKVHRPGRAHRHAGPPGPRRGDGNHPAPEPGEGHHHCAYHPLHGRGGPGGAGWW